MLNKMIAYKRLSECCLRNAQGSDSVREYYWEQSGEYRQFYDILCQHHPEFLFGIKADGFLTIRGPFDPCRETVVQRLKEYFSSALKNVQWTEKEVLLCGKGIKQCDLVARTMSDKKVVLTVDFSMLPFSDPRNHLAECQEMLSCGSTEKAVYINCEHTSDIFSLNVWGMTISTLRRNQVKNGNGVNKNLFSDLKVDCKVLYRLVAEAINVRK